MSFARWHWQRRRREHLEAGRRRLGRLRRRRREFPLASLIPLLSPMQVAASNPRALLGHTLWKQRTALHAAARAGATEALCAVLDVAAHTARAQLNAFMNAPDYGGDTALALACKHGCVGCSGQQAGQHTDDCCVGPGTSRRDIRSTEICATPSCIPGLLSLSALSPPSSLLSYNNSYDDTARELLEAGASPLPANSQGVTALHFAAARGHAPCMRLLLSTTVRLAGEQGCLPHGSTAAVGGVWHSLWLVLRCCCATLAAPCRRTHTHPCSAPPPHHPPPADGTRCPAAQAPVPDIVDMERWDTQLVVLRAPTRCPCGCSGQGWTGLGTAGGGALVVPKRCLLRTGLLREARLPAACPLAP